MCVYACIYLSASPHRRKRQRDIRGKKSKQYNDARTETVTEKISLHSLLEVIKRRRKNTNL